MADRSLGLTSKPKGELKAYEPTLRDQLAWLMSDTFGGGDRSKRNYLNEKTRGLVDWVPGLGEAAGTDETLRAAEAGNWKNAALGAGSLAMGVTPIGDAARLGVKKAWRDVYHGTFAPKRFEVGEGIKSGIPTNRDQMTPVDAGIHVTDDPMLASSYAGLRLTGAPPDEMVGGRVIPYAADLGNNLSGNIRDMGNWTNRDAVLKSLRTHNVSREGDKYKWAEGTNPDITRIYGDVKDGATIEEALKARGFDSLSYDGSYHSSKPLGDNSHLIMDPAQLVPRLSPQGLGLTSSPRQPYNIPQWGAERWGELQDFNQNYPFNAEEIARILQEATVKRK